MLSSLGSFNADLFNFIFVHWHKYITDQWGVGVVGGPACAVWVALFLLFPLLLPVYLYFSGFPQVARFRFAFVVTHARSRDNRSAGSVLKVQFMQWWVSIATFVLFGLGFMRSLETNQSMELARAGGLIVIAGLWSALFGIWESHRIRDSWSKFSLHLTDQADKIKLAEVVQRNMDKSQLRTAFISLTISSIGTIFWAYGDQFIACNSGISYPDAAEMCRKTDPHGTAK